MFAKIIRVWLRFIGSNLVVILGLILAVIVVVLFAIIGILVFFSQEIPPALISICQGIFLLAVVGIGVLEVRQRLSENRATKQAQSKAEGVASREDIAELDEVLMDENTPVREAAVKAMAKITETRSAESLLADLRHTHSWIRKSAADSLKMTDLPDDPTIHAWYIVAKGNWDEAASLGSVAVEPLLNALHDPVSEVRCEVARALGKIGDVRAVQPILDALTGFDSRMISVMASALGQIKDRHAVELLMPALRNSNENVRWVAASALGEIGDPSALAELDRMAREDKGGTYDDGSVKNAAQWAAGQIRWHNRPIEEVIAALHDRNWETRCYAVDALGKSNDARAVELLITTLHDPKLNVRVGAVNALAKISNPRAVETLMAILVGKDNDLRRSAIGALEKLEALDINPLIAALNDRNADVRIAAAEVLWKTKTRDQRAVDPLIVALRDQNEWVRIHAILALKEIGDPRALSELELLAQRDKLQRKAAHEAVESIRKHMEGG